MAHHGRQSADDVLVVALACGSTLENAARKANVSARTAHRRLADPAFKKRLADVRADMVQRTSGMLTAASLEAVKTLVELQASLQAPAIRLGAARTILELGVRLRETIELSERLQALEEQVLQTQIPS